MIKWEDKVVDALCKQEAEYIVKAMHDPVHQEEMRELIREYSELILQLVPEDWSKEEKAAIAVKANPMAIYTENLNNESGMRKAAFKSARGRYVRSRSEEEKAYNYGRNIDNVKKKNPEMGAKWASMLEKYYACLEGTWKFNTTLIDDFVQIAKKSSVQQAVSTESVKAIFWKHLPTKAEYLAHFATEIKSSTAALIEYIDGINEMVAAPSTPDEDPRMMKWKFLKKAFEGPGESLGVRHHMYFASLNANRIYE